MKSTSVNPLRSNGLNMVVCCSCAEPNDSFADHSLHVVAPPLHQGAVSQTASLWATFAGAVVGPEPQALSNSTQ